jgi:hypothetical protein
MAAVVLMASLVAQSAGALELEGHKIPPRVKLSAESPELVLNGAGVRTRAFVRVYVGSLYVGAKRTTTPEVLADKGPKRVSLTMLRDVTTRQLVDGLNDGIRDNHTPAELEVLKPRIGEFSALMSQFGGPKTGTVIALDYLPGTGTVVTVDGAARGKPIAGEDFYHALLRIWLGDEPVDRNLKRAMLGQ